MSKTVPEYYQLHVHQQKLSYSKPLSLRVRVQSVPCGLAPGLYGLLALGELDGQSLRQTRLVGIGPSAEAP